MKIDYLHSWDTSYIAAATCDLYAVNSKDTSKVLMDSISIDPNKCGHHKNQAVTGTYICPHVVSVKYKPVGYNQFMSLECHSKEIGKSACIGGLELFLEDSTANQTTSESNNKDDEKELMQILHQPEFYKPTADELQRGMAFAAPQYWGVHVRCSKSLRVAFIGGSQTAMGEYVDIFRETMKSIASNIGWSLTVYNEGVSGQYPSIRPFKFLSLDSSEWPNVICIEPCLDCATSEHLPCSLSIDNMKYFINRKYEQQGLDQPYYMFLEFFDTKEIVLSTSWNATTSPDSIGIVSQPFYVSMNSTNKHSHAIHDRGSSYSKYMMDLARFYGMPVLSVTDVFYPSWVRFCLLVVSHHYKETKRESGWPYTTTDGYHINRKGCQLVVDHILKPFFLDQMLPRESDKLYEKKRLPFSPYPAHVDLRMFMANFYQNIDGR